MSSLVDKRIIRELKSLNESKKDLIDNGIHFWFDEANIRKVYALFIGQDKTPYKNGFFIISFEFPDNYPWQPPLAKYETQGFCFNRSDRPVEIRFNPNLYTNGKVCLSMLNTWQGPGWTPANTIHNVFIAIQSLVLNEYPLQNEPGFENENMNKLVDYNNIITYATMKISVIEFVNNLISHPDILKPEHLAFKDVVIDYFNKNIEWYKNLLNENKVIYNEKPILNSPCYNMSIKMDYDFLIQRFNEISH